MGMGTITVYELSRLSGRLYVELLTDDGRRSDLPDHFR